MLRNVGVVFVAALMFALVAHAQDSGAQKSTSCTFADGTSVTVRYHSTTGEQRVSFGSAWTPSAKPIVLFTETPLRIGATNLDVGAYTMYLLPDKKNWELIVNSDVSAKEYDPSHDIVKVPLQRGELPNAAPELSMTVVHSEPKVCSLTIYYQKNGFWTDIKQQ